MKIHSRFITSKRTLIKKEKISIRYFEKMIKIKERRNDMESVEFYKNEIAKTESKIKDLKK